MSLLCIARAFHVGDVVLHELIRRPDQNQIRPDHSDHCPAEPRKTAGTLTLSNTPPTRNATVDDVLQMGILAETRPLRELFDTLGGTPLCYVYV
ncbi:Tyrosinase-like protein orsC [Apiospora marii]|uniref:Tyrosinase-like protein orsC n=1 Tax=Apiospora marii TaxID=335849 RepID=A0ABR1RJT7_9PEZI